MEPSAAGADGGDIKTAPSRDARADAGDDAAAHAEKQQNPSTPSPAPSSAERGQAAVVDDPMRWSAARKWTVTLGACYFSSLISVAASAYSLGIDAMTRDLGEPRLLLVAGISAFTLSCALLPLVLAPLSEAVGRRYVYLVSYAIFFLFFLPVALAQNAATVLVSRFLCGAAGSVGSTMVGGTLGDIWLKEERTLPMALFALSALAGTPMGPVGFAWATIDGRWRWIHWAMLLLGAPSMLFALLFLNRETLPKKLLQRSGNQDGAEARQGSMAKLRGALSVSAIRPLRFLFTEPITTVLCIWISFAWGCLYLFLQSVPLVFAQHGFRDENGTTGLAFVGLAVGAVLGFLAYVFSTRRWPMQKHHTPEARLREACVGGVLFAAAFFFYAWTTLPSLPWIVPQIASALLMAGLFLFYVSIFQTFGDIYGSYASSALAAQSFSRNIFATAFPLFARRMYEALGYQIATTVLACIAAVLALSPFVLIRVGARLRAASPFAVKLEEEAEAGAGADLPRPRQ